MTPLWLSVGFGGFLLSLLSNPVSAQSSLRLAAAPIYNGREQCPTRCSTAGPSSGNWSAYHNLEQLQSCPETMFYNYNIYDPIDDPSLSHRIYACTSFGPDWAMLPDSPTKEATVVKTVNATYEIGWWSEIGKFDAAGIKSLSSQMREYFASGYGLTNETAFSFGQSDQATLGPILAKVYKTKALFPMLSIG